MTVGPPSSWFFALSTGIPTAGPLTARLGPDERCTTLEIKINDVAPATDGTLSCEAAVVERTRRIGVLEARVRDGGSRLVALATGSFYVVPARPVEP